MTITPTIGITAGAFPLMLARDPSRIDDVRFRTLFPESVVRDMERQAKNIPPGRLRSAHERLAADGRHWSARW